MSTRGARLATALLVLAFGGAACAHSQARPLAAASCPPGGSCAPKGTRATGPAVPLAPGGGAVTPRGTAPPATTPSAGQAFGTGAESNVAGEPRTGTGIPWNGTWTATGQGHYASPGADTSYPAPAQFDLGLLPPNPPPAGWSYDISGDEQVDGTDAVWGNMLWLRPGDLALTGLAFTVPRSDTQATETYSFVLRSALPWLALRVGGSATTLTPDYQGFGDYQVAVSRPGSDAWVVRISKDPRHPETWPGDIPTAASLAINAAGASPPWRTFTLTTALSTSVPSSHWTSSFKLTFCAGLRQPCPPHS
ncbi:MAG: hypothetical protein ACYDAQ_14390 [Mycobacteriales bacterium]